ncbi:MAG: ATP-binding cassette domain-containing protein [Verrucomicrobia bacterium]|nr:ATP-binding cassette domain-containing protein [Verrucomicrobiota bacterium]
MSASDSPSLIELRDAAIAPPSAPGVLVLEHLNWRIAAGDFWVIGGLQSSGKSLLLHCAAGLLPPAQGSLRLFDQEIAELSREDAFPLLLRVGLVFENDARLFTRLTLAENVALPLRYHFNANDADATSRVQPVLEATGLLDFAGLSAGDVPRTLRQRVGLARALVLQPDVLLIDNPLARLGRSDAWWWRDFLKRLNTGHALTAGKPVAIVVTTDDLRAWSPTGRQFALLDGRGLVCFASRDELETSAHALLPELFADARVAV